LQIGTDADVCDATKVGTLRYNGGMTAYCNGTIWDPLHVAGDAIVNLNGATQTVQSFASPGTTGNSPNWSAAGGVHRVHIPAASNAGVTAGTISKTVFDDFNNKLSSTLTDGTIFVGDGT